MKHIFFINLVIFLSAISTQAIAQNNVVVIPLLGDDGVKAPTTESSGDNGTYSTASRAYGIVESTEITGNISTVGDVDYYEVFLPYCHELTAEIKAAGGDKCGSVFMTQPYIDTYVTMFKRDGFIPLDADEDIGILNFCSLVQGVSSEGEGYYYIRVEASLDNCADCVFDYKLVLSNAPSVC